ncbi:unnamed protein product [Peronospora belbahrii]|uniref:RxLR effector protein n=1 Tax=Peronospora belbahrii TaxID=622444 RepID=A0ABN8CVE0_9STRA|nr:unnamed protein product [Peronospora belbahrii]
MKAFFLIGFAPVLFMLSMATHAPPPERVLSSVANRKGEVNGDILGGDGGFGDDDIGDIDGQGDIDGGIGGVSGYRALRGLNDELLDGDAQMNRDEVVVAGGTVARGGVAVARPRPRRGRFY